METTILNATEYRDVSLSLLNESKTNPRRIFEEAALKELADSIRSQGVLSPLLVRSLTERSFEIIAGARRLRAAQIAEVPTVPVRIVKLSDAEALEAQLIENLQRRDVHPLEEAQGFRAILNLDEPKYTVEQIAAKTGKSSAYVTTRLKLTELSATVVDAFYAEEIGVGHALLLAKLQPGQQESALAACFREDWSGAGKQKRILLPVRNLQFWIDNNILLVLKDAPFDKKDAQLVPAVGSCVDCPKRTGHNKLLFSEMSKQDACTDPTCYQGKADAHIVKAIAAKPKLLQVSTAYGQQQGSATLPRNKYTEIRMEKPKTKEEATLWTTTPGRFRCYPIDGSIYRFESLRQARRPWTTNIQPQHMVCLLPTTKPSRPPERADGDGNNCRVESANYQIIARPISSQPRSTKGYTVEGFAPTSRAAKQLRDAGIEASTLQSFLSRSVQSNPAGKRFYFVDESSLASTRQMRDFLTRLDPNDRVLLIGDVRQHQGVEAGPRRLTGVSVYREVTHDFAIGDRVQFTAPDKSLNVANRDLAIIESISSDNRIVAEVGGGRRIEFNATEHRHFDHGYAATSHSSQGLTAEHVLIHADTSVYPDLLNSRFGYVAVSRASREATIFTDDVGNLVSTSERILATPQL